MGMKQLKAIQAYFFITMLFPYLRGGFSLRFFVL